MKVSVLVIMVVAAVFCTVSVASASDGGAWSFSTNANPASSDVINSGFGAMIATVNVDADTGTGWHDTITEYGSAQGWWDIGIGSIVLGKPTPVSSTQSGSIWVEVVYWSDITQAPVVTISSDAAFISKDTALVEAGPVQGGWYKDTWKWSGSLDQLAVTVTGDQFFGSQIDRINVVPEPSALAALCTGVMGLVGLISRRRRA